MDDRTQRNLAQEERISDLGSDTCAAHDGLADLKAVRSQDIALLAVGIHNQCDACRTIRIVLDRFHSCSNAILHTLEVHMTIHTFVTAADVANRHLTRIVTSA